MSAPQLSPEQREAFAQALYAGRKIEAIRQLRQMSGLDLKDSKDIIDRLEAELRAQHPERFIAADSSKKTLFVALFLFIAITVTVLYYLFHR
jgi:ribosomal protein L7/L12